MKMIFRRKRIVLLSAVALLFALMVADIWIKQADVFEAFGGQFVNERRTQVHEQAQREATATVERELAIDGSGMAGVRLSGAGGPISVERAEGSIVRLEYTVAAAAGSEAEAQRRAEAVQVEQSVADGYVTLSAVADGRPIGGEAISVDYALFVPDGVSVRIERGEGGVRIRGIAGDVNAESVGGTVEIADVGGHVAVDSRYGSVYVTAVRGNVDVTNRYGTATIDRTEGNVALDSQSGHSYIYRVRGQVTGTVHNDVVRLGDIDGSVHVRAEGADVQLERIRGDVDMVSSRGQTSLVLAESEAGYALHIRAARGDIHPHGELPVPVEREADGAREARLNGVIGNGARDVRIDAEGGDVVIHYQ